MAITQSTILPLRSGNFTISYHDIAPDICVSVSYGDVTSGSPVVRLHSSCLFGESLHSLDCECADQLTSTLKLIKKNRSGVVVYRYAEGRGIGLENKIKALELQRTQKLNTVEAFRQLGFDPDPRTYGAELAALKDLNVATSIKLASQNPRKAEALRQAGFYIVEELHPAVRVTKYNLAELTAKKMLLAHHIPAENLTKAR